MKADLRVKIRNFIKKYKTIILLVIIGWLILIAINAVLKNQKPSQKPQTSYEPFVPIIQTGEETPKDIEEPIEELISKYIEYCNNKDYEKAYEMISKDCKEYVYPDIIYFKNYVDYVFKSYKVYSIQNYSNYNNVYIYRIRIFDDILATGLTGEESFRYFEEKIAFTKENGKILMSLKGFIKKENLDLLYSDKNISITAKSKIINYDEQTYNTEVENKTNNYMLIYSKNINSKISIKTTRGKQDVLDENILQENIVLAPGEKRVINLSFDIYYDAGIENKEIVFENVTLLKQYSDVQEIKNEDILQVLNATMQVK